MSLIHWWPLNGDTKDYGINSNNLVNNGATINNAGKIGKCYSFNGNSSKLYTNITLTNTMSFCCWVNLANNNESFIIDARNSSGNGYQPIYIGVNYGIQFYSSQSGISTKWDAQQCNLTSNSWYHIVVVVTPSSASLYINGNLISMTPGSYGYNYGTSLLSIGSRYSDTLFLNGKLNDIRIYDHALSIKEIKEISKGLMLHYNFEDFNRENLFKNPLITSSTYSSKTSQGDVVVTYTPMSSLAGKTLVFAYDYSIEGAKYYNNTGDIYKDRYGIHGVIQYTVGTDTTVKASYPFAGYLTVSGTGTAIQKTTIPSSWNVISLSFANQTGNKPAENNSNTWYIKNLKLEIIGSENDMPSDSITTANSVIYDNSGYGYNGTINGNLTLANDSTIPSGTKSMKFASDSYLDIPVFPEFKELTCSFWIKIPNATVSYRSLFNQLNSPTGSLWLSVNTESYGLWSYMASSPSYSGAGDMLQANTWYFATFVFNNGYANWYLNGEYLGRNVFYPSRLVIPSTHFCLGDSYSGGSWSGTPFDGWIADFKLFATALSAEDIKAEYTRKASIDRNGNLFTGEILEESSNVSITKKNQVQTYSFKEGNDIAKFYGGYTQLEYIESTGTQYINTNVISSYNLTLETSIAITEEHPTTKYRSLFGNEASWVMNFVEDSTGIRWVGQDINMYITTYSLNEKMFIYAGKDFMYKNGVSIPRSADGNSVSYGNFLIGKGYNNTTIGKFKLYNFKIYDSGELVRDFVPAKRNKDSIIGLYDLVEHKFYTNQGTGTFTGGTELGPLSAIAINEIKEI